MLGLSGLVTSSALAQVYVFPRTAEKSHVINFDFAWRHIDILVGPEAGPEIDPGPQHDPLITQITKTSTGAPVSSPATSTQTALPVARSMDNPGFPLLARAETPSKAPPQAAKPGKDPLGEKSGGVRLYFYERERTIAQRAASTITHSYRQLAKSFNYVPRKTFPYILYSSYQEFLQTHLFPLQEGVLGVTSPKDLKLTLPYMGDHRLFEEVSTHEMAHQFTIQKLQSLAEDQKLAGSPIDAMPLWFIEGLAEFYAQRGLKPEAEMMVRDILLNPNVEEGFAMLDFFEDRPYSVLWTYKAGNVRCAFLEERYGAGFLQKVLDNSGLLVSDKKSKGVPSFAALLEKLTGDDARTISKSFETWIKRRSYQTFLDTQQDASQFKPLAGARPTDLVLTMTSSPDGKLLLMRGISPDTGDSQLMLAAHDRPGQSTPVIVDGMPGFESLHPIADRNFDLTGNRLLFVAEAMGRDVIYVQSFESKKGGMRLKDRQSISMAPLGILGVFSPSLSPDGKSVAFIGMNEEGQRDLYLVHLADPSTLVRMTFDVHAERQVTWGPSGLVFTSDATSHGRYNLFRIDPAKPGVVERLTTENRDEQDPRVLPDGRIFFTAYDGSNANLQELVDGKIIRRTDVSTGVFDVAPGADGGVWTLMYRSGRRWPVVVPASELQSAKPQEQPPGAQGEAPKQLDLSKAVPYEAYNRKNWQLGPIFGVMGGGSGGIVGQLMASAHDQLGNHGLVLGLAVYGSFDLTDGQLLYINQEKRLTYGTGLFQSLRYREDKTFEGDVDLPFTFFSGERFFGALGSVRYPINRFVHVQTELAVGGVNYFLLDQEQTLLEFPQFNGTGLDLYDRWQAANNGTRFQTELTVRFGVDTLRHHYATGPVSGNSLLLEGSIALQPAASQEVFGYGRLDASRYFSLVGRSNFFLRVGAGASTSGRFTREFFLSSYDTLRGVPFGDTRRLLGGNFLYSTAEVQFPLNSLLRIFFLSDIEGIAGLDFGGVGDDAGDLWDKRVLDGVLGVNFGMGPLSFRLHFAKNFDIGAEAGTPVPTSDWVTNFSIGIAGLSGFGFDRPMLPAVKGM